MVELPGSRKTQIIVAAVVASLVLVGIIGVAVLAQSGGSIFESDPGLTIIDFDEEAAYADETYLTGLGPRPGGSEAEMKGAQYVADQFNKAGLDQVMIEEYDAEVFEIHKAEVSIISYGPFMRFPMFGSTPQRFEHTVDYVVQGYSGSRSAASGPMAHSTDLEIYPVGNGTDQSKWNSAGGKAALVTYEATSPSTSEMMFIARDAGAEALILNNHHLNEDLGYAPLFKGTYLVNGETQRPNIPIFMTTKAMGDQLANGASNSKVRIDFDITIENRPVPVTVGILEGSSSSDDFVVIGAHMDTVYNGIGAWDNTVGVVSVIAQARALAKYTPKHDIRFITFGAEEIGIIGAYKYAEAHSQEITDHCIHMFNSDMPNCDPSRDNRLWIGTSTNKTLGLFEDAKSKLLEIDGNKYQKYNLMLTYSELGPYSDHWPFMQLGSGGTFAGGAGAKEYHTYLDDLSHVHIESTGYSARAMGSVALYMADQ